MDGFCPLRGLLTVLEQSSTPIVAVVTVDMRVVGEAVAEKACAKLAVGRYPEAALWGGVRGGDNS